MKVVIDIPEELACDGFERPFTEEEKNIFIKAIGNGTPLPKGHGRLIDADDLLDNTCLDEIPTIIEADKRESENEK